MSRYEKTEKPAWVIAAEKQLALERPNTTCAYCGTHQGVCTRYVSVSRSVTRIAMTICHNCKKLANLR